MQAVAADVVPGQKADAADEDQQHDRHIDHRLRGIAGQRGELAPHAHQVKARVAEGRHGMEQRHPQPPRAEIPAEDRRHRGGAQKLDNQRRPNDEAGQAHDAAHLRRGDRLLHGAALHQGDLASGDQREGGGDGDDAHAADLDEEHDDELPEERPIGRRIVQHQAGHADRRGRGEQRVQKRRPAAVPAGDGQHQQQRAQQNHAEKAEDNDLKRRQSSFRVPSCIHVQRLLYASLLPLYHTSEPLKRIKAYSPPH